MYRTLTTTPLAVGLLALLTISAPHAHEPGAKTTNATIKEHMEVVGSDKQHVGTVDKYEGTNIKLTKNDPASGGKHHSIPSSMVGTVTGNTVVLSKTAKEAMSEWSETDK